VSSQDVERPFESIESAHEYLSVLATTVLEAMGDLKRDQDKAAREGAQRKAEAIGLAIYKLKLLNCSVCKSRRMLNDLRILRRLILNERASVESLMATL
jgi:hypothetical protein